MVSSFDIPKPLRRTKRKNMLSLWIQAHPLLTLLIAFGLVWIVSLFEHTVVDPMIPTAHAEEVNQNPSYCMTNKECCDFYFKGAFASKDSRIMKLCAQYN